MKTREMANRVVLRQSSECLKIAALNPVIEFITKSHYGGPELVYVVSSHKEALQDLTGAKTLSPRHVKALKDLGFTFKQQSASEKVL